MDAELWKQVDALLEEALDQLPEKREAFVEENAKDNPGLREEVLSLLKAQSHAQNFMERSAMRVAAAGLARIQTLLPRFHLSARNSEPTRSKNYWVQVVWARSTLLAKPN